MSYAHPDIVEADNRRADHEADERADQVDDLQRAFLLVASVGDVSADAAFAPRRIDPTKPRVDGQWQMRRSTVGEVLAEGFDFARGPTVEGDVMALLCRVAMPESNPKRGDVKSDAAALLARAAATWADMTCEGA